jgi:hypothetical protein
LQQVEKLCSSERTRNRQQRLAEGTYDLLFVPIVYGLLSDTRPSTFWFGSEEFDPKKLGFVQTETGHWFTNDRSRPGRIGSALSKSQKSAIIEYLKSATPANYPARSISKVPAAPCENDPN